MIDQIELAQNRLFGDSGIRAMDIKFFPGSQRDTSAEDLATELNKSLALIEAGDYEIVDECDD